MRQNLQLLETTQGALAECEQLEARMGQRDERMAILMQIPGKDLFGALVILTEIGQITRFADAKKLCGYAGLVPSVYRSRQRNSGGPIPKAGLSRLRRVVLEAGHVAVRHAAQSARFFRCLKERRESNVAVIATARKMLVIIQHLVSGNGVYRGRRVEIGARKYQEWGWAVAEKDGAGSNKHFISERLRLIALYHPTRFRRGKDVFYLTASYS